MSISARLRAEQLSVFFDSRISSNAAIAGLTSAGWVWDRHLQSSSVLLFYYRFCRGPSPKWVLDSGFFASVQWLFTRLLSLWLLRTFRIFTVRQGARSPTAGLFAAASLPAMDGWINSAKAEQVYLRCDVTGVDRTIWEITLDEEAGKAWVYKPAFRSSAEYPATFTTEEVGFGKQLPYMGPYLSNVLDRLTGALTSDIPGLGAPDVTAICEIHANSTTTA